MIPIRFWKQDDIFDIDALISLVYCNLTINTRKQSGYNLPKMFHLAMKHKLGDVSQFVSSVIWYENKTYWDLTMTAIWTSKMIAVNVAFSQAYLLTEHIRDATYPNARIEWHALYILRGAVENKNILKTTLEISNLKYEVLIPLSHTRNLTDVCFGKCNEVFPHKGGAIVFNKSIRNVHILKKRSQEQLFLYAKILD